MRRGNDPAFKEQAQKLYPEGLELRVVGRILGVHHKMVPLACPVRRAATSLT